MAVTSQPGSYAASEFQTSLTDCGSDCGVCCYGLFCIYCMGCSMAGDMNECCMCGVSASLRSVYRTRYNINGSLLSDFVAYMCCPWCAVCQLKRDIDLRKEQGIF